MRLRDAVSTFRGHRVPHFRIIEHRTWWFTVSGVFLALALVGLFVIQLSFSIDFNGGALLSFTNRSGASISDYQATMAKFKLGDSTVEIVNGNQVQIRTKSSLTSLSPSATPTPTPSVSASASASPSATASPTASPSATASSSASPTTSPSASATPTVVATTPPPQNVVGDNVRRALAQVAGISVDEINQNDVGPTWGSQISKKALQGLIIFLILVTVYISFRFEWKMAVAALVALLHDLVITAGIYALVGRQVTPASVIAILTILGYSLYDTVVIFDKVKENTDNAALVSRETYAGVVNLSLNQTLMRSVNTSLVVLLPIGALLLFGGTTLKDFAFALFVGVASGTYSSIFVASPILTILKEREPRYQQIRARAEQRQTRPALRAVPSRAAAAAAGEDGANGRRTTPVGTATGAGARQSSGARPARPAGQGGGAKRKGSKPKPKRRRR